MLTQTASQLKSNDVFTANDGADWHLAVDVYHVRVGGFPAVVLTTDEQQKIWLWATEEVVVRL